MLRIGFMPSDFHPVLLVLGEHSDLVDFGDILAAFAETGGERALTGDGARFPADSAIVMREHDASQDGRPGLWPGPDGGLLWSLPRERARQFAGNVADLAQSGDPSGSVTLECAQLGEIRVVVSVGEWDDDFLGGSSKDPVADNSP